MHFIGFAGQAQNGKDTAADWLRAKLNENMAEEFWYRSAFAKNVKRIFCEVFGKDQYFVEKWKTNPEAPPDLDMAVRPALQFIGDGFRQIKGSIWIDMMFRTTTQPTIISDARYINELRAIKMHGGLVVVIARPGSINNDPNGSEAQIKPLAEWAIRNKDFRKRPVKEWVNFASPDTPPEAEYVDWIVVNDNTKEVLYAEIEEYLVPAVEQYFNTGAKNAIHQSRS
jgi:hypothetical protein